MASYTYSLVDRGDGAVAAYFGTASMSTINANQSSTYDITYVENNMSINTDYLEWGSTESEPAAAEVTPTQYWEEFYVIPSNIDGLVADSTTIFEWKYYSLAKEYGYSLDSNWYLEGTSAEGEEIELNGWILKETYQILSDSYDIVVSPEMTIVLGAISSPEGTWSTNEAVGTYQNLGASDPRVTGITDEKASYSYTPGELAGIRTKFASPAGSTSLSLMQAMISSSTAQIYNTSNISRFNFKKTRAEVLKPREVSSIDLVKDFNRPYRGTTSG